jgi:hypothetical protein
LPGELVAVLLIAATVAVLYCLGSLLVATVAHAAMKRLGVEFWSLLLWFGLAEAREDELAARRAAPVRGPVRDRRALAR